MNKSGLYGLEWKTRDTYSLVGDSLVTRMHCTAGQVPQNFLSTWYMLETISPHFRLQRRLPHPPPTASSVYSTDRII